MAGPLTGLRIVEIASIGPGPFCGMMLADHGAEVIRIDRPGGQRAGVRQSLAKDILARSRRIVTLDLKSAEGREQALDLIGGADGLIEGYRPGVMERLGLGPAEALARNPQLVYGRMTGWGQEGPLAQTPGHDINYIALAGNLHTYGPAAAPPFPPLNAVGDFGGGGLMLAFGMVSAMLHAQRTGEGQVVDCAMIDGAALISAMTWSFLADQSWSDERGANLLDGGAPFYRCYETADGKFVALGAIEPAFWQAFRDGLGEAGKGLPGDHQDRDGWPDLSAALERIFRTRTRDAWVSRYRGTDACLTPVLSLSEVSGDPHIRTRGTFGRIDGVVQPMPAPRYSASVLSVPRMTRGPETSDI